MLRVGVRKRGGLVFCTIVAASLATLAAATASARPGGGGSYHGGTGGFGGGSPSRGGGFGGTFLPGPSYGGSGAANGGSGTEVILVVVIAVVVVLVLVAHQRRSSADAMARDALLQAQDRRSGSMRGSRSIARLVVRDPALTEQSIVDHVRAMAILLREAWCAGDMGPARAFVSDAVFGRFQVQLELMRGENRRNVMRDARLLAVALEAVDDDPPLEVVHVRVTAEARDTEVRAGASDDEVRAALDQARVEPYVEVWSLVRRMGAQSKPVGFDVGRTCPSCGAPLGAGETIRCRYCGVLVCSGEHDWVLAEITQLVEWHPSARPVPGLDALRARDPGVARAVLQDRASYLFWKWLQAGRAATPAVLRKCATSRFLAAVMNGAHAEWMRGARDVAVGGAELFVCNLDGDGADRVYVKIFWSARFGATAGHTPMQIVMCLARKAGVTSTASMTSLVCASCGAPVGESDATTCDHCGVELAAGDHAWVLDGVLRPEDVPAPARRPSGVATDDGIAAAPDIADPRERRILFARMAQVMASDGAIDRRERKLLQMCALRWNIPQPQVNELLTRPPLEHYGEPLVVRSPGWFLAGLVSAAMADGRVDARERALIEHACDALGLPREEIDRHIVAASRASV